MKKFFALISLCCLLFFSSCVDEIVVDDPVDPTGKIILESVPDSAQIFLLGTNTNKFTPDSITGLTEGSYQIILKKAGFIDTTFVAQVYKDLTTSLQIILRPVFSKGSVFIESEPSGAQIFLEGDNTQKVTPDTLKALETGDYDITLKLSGYFDTTFTMSVQKDQVVSKNIELIRIIERGSFFIQSQPSGANIFLNSRDLGKETPDTINNLEIGSYQLTLKLVDFEDTTFSAQIESNKVTFVNVVLKEKSPVEIDTLFYNVIILFNQTQFTFSFNQDITLKTVKAIESDSSGSTTFYFNDEFIQKGSTRTITYPTIKEGEWELVFDGNKVTGINAQFILSEKIEIKR